MKKWTVITLVVLCFLSVTVAAGWASRPVHRKSQGCVIKGTVYGIYDSRAAYPYILPKSFDLKPYEGKKVELEGTLSPGDHFVPKGKTLKVLGPCDSKSLELIRKAEGK